jgi:hypothetical protein
MLEQRLEYFLQRGAGKKGCFQERTRSTHKGTNDEESAYFDEDVELVDVFQTYLEVRVNRTDVSHCRKIYGSQFGPRLRSISLSILGFRGTQLLFHLLSLCDVLTYSHQLHGLLIVVKTELSLAV